MPDYIQLFNALHPALRDAGQGSGKAGQDMNASSGDPSSHDDPTRDVNSSEEFLPPGAVSVLTSDQRKKAKQAKPRTPSRSRAELIAAAADVMKQHPAHSSQLPPVVDPAKGIKIRQANNYYFPDILAFGAKFGLRPAHPETYGGNILDDGHENGAKGPHGRGQAVDFRLHGTPFDHNDKLLNYLVQQALAAGYRVEDARDDGGNAHLHVQTTDFPGGHSYITSSHAKGGKTYPRKGIFKPNEQTRWMTPLPDPRQKQSSKPLSLDSMDDSTSMA